MRYKVYNSIILGSFPYLSRLGAEEYYYMTKIGEKFALRSAPYVIPEKLPLGTIVIYKTDEVDNSFELSRKSKRRKFLYFTSRPSIVTYKKTLESFLFEKCGIYSII